MGHVPDAMQRVAVIESRETREPRALARVERMASWAERCADLAQRCPTLGLDLALAGHRTFERRLGPARRDVNDVLATTDLAERYWVWDGMLRGWAREGRLLRHDRDADFGIMAADVPVFEAAAPTSLRRIRAGRSLAQRQRPPALLPIPPPRAVLRIQCPRADGG